MTVALDGVLFFPVTPFAADGAVDHGLLADLVTAGVGEGAGGVFAACGTGEFHALDAEEAAAVTATAVKAAAGAIPVVAGAGGPVRVAARLLREAEQSGADAALLLPPYLVSGPQSGLRRWVETVMGDTALPVILYHRGSAVYSPSTVKALATDPRVIGFKDGAGDIALAQQIVAAVSEVRPGFLFFNGLLTAELSQSAYRGIGVHRYSSAVFAMAPRIANAYYRAYTAGDEAARLRLIREFFAPLVELRDEVPGFGVSLIKAGLRARGIPVGSVRAPLADPDPVQTDRLVSLLEAGERLADEVTSPAS